MTRAQVDALPRKDAPQGAYAKIQKMECPNCGGRLRSEDVTYFSYDQLNRGEGLDIVSKTVTRAAGCGPCKIIYRFEEHPLVSEHFE